VLNLKQAIPPLFRLHQHFANRTCWPVHGGDTALDDQSDVYDTATQVSAILTQAGVSTWTSSANATLGGDLTFTDETDMHTGYSSAE